MEAIQSASPSVPAAPIVGADGDAGVIGTPFFVMEFVDGDVPAVDPPYTATGFFADARAGAAPPMVADGLRVLAAPSTTSTGGAAGLAGSSPAASAPTLARQLDLWAADAARSSARAGIPASTRALERLAAVTCHRLVPGLCWGDPRPGNMIWRDFRCVCVTDFEAAAIAPPELDLGWWLMFDRACHEVVGARASRGAGREEQRDLYEASSGRVVGDTNLLSRCSPRLRYAVIVVRVMNRAVARGLMPEDHNIWLKTPAATCLDELLEVCSRPSRALWRRRVVLRRRRGRGTSLSSARGPVVPGADQAVERLQRGIERRPGMKGTRTRSRVRAIMMTQT